MEHQMEQLSFLNIEHKQQIVNVSQVKQLSPFRYPGGKTWLVPKFIEWISHRPRRPRYLIEPFAGGGIISLSVANSNLVDKCIMIEKDEEVAAVWKTIFYGDWRWLTKRIESFNLNIDTAREVFEDSANTIEEVAFRTILKNRICHGGIIAAGAGFLKRGENGKGIHSRWYPDTLVKRINTIVLLKDKIDFYEGDAFDFIPKYCNDKNAVLFVDPPYTASEKKAGKRLYRYYDIDHDKLLKALYDAKSEFMLTYDYDDMLIQMIEKYGFYYEKVPMTGTHNTIKYELLIYK